MSHSLNDYLRALNPDSPDDTPAITAQEVQDELALWSGMQFNFDNSQSSPLSLLPSPSFMFDQTQLPTTGASASSTATAGLAPGSGNPSLTNLPSGLDYMPLRQDHSHQQQPTPSAAATGTTTPTNGLVPPLNNFDALIGLFSSSRSSAVPVATDPALLAATVAHSFPTNSTHRSAMAAFPTILPNHAVPKPPAAATPSPTKATTKPSSDGEATGGVPTHNSSSVHETSSAKGKTEQPNETDHVAEEDKRRRNTAASARFRAKKKLREQAMERTAKEMTAKVEMLEKRVRGLETENKWLRGLITEKNPDLLQLKAQVGSSTNESNDTTATSPQPPPIKRQKLLPSTMAGL
ncbi:hypothetical protein H4R34_000117 [Dimargaris verticillata]|uniref:BZIP domain-containing protein n=1 Tax=Dimargaris verticillata TaxID=2761393 RepID=A0A9W8B7C1_9FUNG|nr:hypothetical protein H4R34_000117 [Dimargaris verticillata]